MIARIWRGWTTAVDAAAYAKYVRETGLTEYRRTPGNQGAWLLVRRVGDRTEFVTLSFWESENAIRAFAGDEPEKAVFYPNDDQYLVDRELRVAHYELTDA